MTADAETLGDRIKHAMAIFAARQRGKRTDHATFGEVVAGVEGIGHPYSASEVFDWLANRSVPSYETLLAIAELARFTAPAQIGRLAYGREFPIHGLNPADYNRFHGLAQT